MKTVFTSWLLTLLICASPAIHAHTYEYAGTEDPANNIPMPIGLSADGKVAVGSQYCMGYQCGPDQMWTPEGLTVIDYNAEAAFQLAANQTIIGLEAADLSADGVFITGRYRIHTQFTPNASTWTYDRPFRWSQSGGFEVLPLLAGHEGGGPEDMSSDGSTVVGFSKRVGWDWEFNKLSESGGFAVRWTNDDIQTLPVPGFAMASTATHVSADGESIAGKIELANDVLIAAHWSGTGELHAIGFLPGGNISYPTAISADGSVVIGYSYTAEGAEGFRWDLENGIQGLGIAGSFGNGTPISFATDISADGSVIVGRTTQDSSGKNQAFRWTEENGMELLGTLPNGSYSSAYRISADGSVIIGTADMGGGRHPDCPATSFLCADNDIFIWTEAAGMISLRSVLNEHGYDLSQWEVNRSVIYISADGKTILANTQIVDTSSPYADTYGGFFRSYVINLDEVDITVDVLPADPANLIDPGAVGPIEVALFGQNAADGDPSNFLVGHIITASVRFGPAEAGQSAAPVASDIDGDGNLDATLTFDNIESGIACGDEDVSIAGFTYAGDRFEATDEIDTSACEVNGCHSF
jgi:probable HAF family extracellular repeat protein